MERDLKKLVASMTLEEKAGMCSGQISGIQRLWNGSEFQA